MEKKEIMRCIEHRSPMLFVDDITESKFGEYAKGLRIVGKDEFWAKGHFPSRPILPGTLLLEAMAQISGFIYYVQDISLKIQLIGVDNAKFIRPVFPGDTVFIEAILVDELGKFSKIKATASVNDKPVAKATLNIFIENKEELKAVTL